MDIQTRILLDTVTGTVNFLQYTDPEHADQILIPVWVTRIDLYYYAKFSKWKLQCSGYRINQTGSYSTVTSAQVEREVKLTQLQAEETESYWVFKTLRGESSKPTVLTSPVCTIQQHYVP